MLSNEDRNEIMALINAVIETRNPIAGVYNNVPIGQDGYNGEIRLSVTKTNQFYISAFINKQWRTAELDI